MALNPLPVQAKGMLSVNLTKLAEDMLTRYPRLASPVLQSAVGLLSPFSRKVPFTILRWEKRVCEAELKVRRGLKDQSGMLHAGAAATAGEGIAAMLLLRNIDWPRYSFSLKELDVVFDKPTAKTVRLICELDPENFEKLTKQLQEKKEASLRLRTDLYAEGDRTMPVAHVRTVWQLNLRKWF